MKDFVFDLQRFAEADAGTDTMETTSTNSTGKSESDSAKQDSTGKDSLGLNEEEVTRRISEALASAKEKWKVEYDKKAEAKKQEQERLSKLSEDERRKAELEASRKELEAKEAELTRKELKLEMMKVLAQRKIPVEFMDYLVDKDSESTLARITTFEKAYKKAIEAGVNERLKGKAPKAGSSSGSAKSTGVKNGFFEAVFKNQVKR